MKPHVARAGHHLAARFGLPESDVGGLAERPDLPTSDHPKGLALDFMVGRDLGDDLAEYVLADRDELAVTYVIWWQRINEGGGWQLMEDRGGPTANHLDHVHLSFSATAPTGTLTC